MLRAAASALALLACGLACGRAAAAGAPAADWPRASKLQAAAMIEKYGAPDRYDDESLTWSGLFGGRRTVVYRAAPGELMVEQSILYRVPTRMIAELALFDPSLKVNPRAGELSARSASLRRNLLLLNLAHEIVNGYKTASEARAFRDRLLRTADAGKFSRYLNGLIFD